MSLPTLLFTVMLSRCWGKCETLAPVVTPTLTVWHSDIFTQSLIAELTLNPGWHDWWPLSTHLTWRDIRVMGPSLRITVSHVCHDPSVVISCLKLSIQFIYILQQSHKLNCQSIISCQRFIKTETHCCWLILSPPSFPLCIAVSCWCPDADPQCSAPLLLTALSLATDWHSPAAT